MRFKLMLLALLAALGCTEKGKSYYDHAPAKKEESRNPLETPPNVEPGDSAARSLEQLADVVLDPKRIESPSALVTRAVLDDLIRFNDLILKLTPEQRLTPEFKSLSRRYRQSLLLGCSEFRASCQGIRYFKQAANSSPVVKLLAKQASENRVGLLIIALELKNRAWDGDLVETLLSVASGPLSSAEARDLTKARQMLSVALADAVKRITDRAAARRFLDLMEGWSLLKARNLQLEDGARHALFELAARADYLRGDDGRLHPGLKLLADELRANPQSVFAKQAMLREQKMFVPEAVGARAISGYDELTFLLDAVYLAEIPAQPAAVLFKSLGQSSRRLREGLENYLRIQFLAALFEGSKMAAAIFTAPVETEGLLRHALNETGAITKVWHAYLAQVAPLKTFALLAADGDEGDRFRIRSAFESLPRSVSQVAGYPHMMALFHFLSKKRFELYLAFIGKTLHTSDLMRWLFEGRLPPLFPYSDDQRTLNHFELIHAFDLAVRTNIFGAVGINIDDFIADTVRRLTEDPIKLVDTTLNRVRTRMAETLGMRELIAICRELDGGPQARREFYFAELNQSPYLGKLNWKVYEAMSAKSTDSSGMAPGSLTREALGLNYADSTFNEALEVTRLDLGTTYRMGSAMLASYRDYLVRFKLPASGLSGAALAAEAEKLTAASRSALEQLQTRRLRTLEFAQKLYRDLGTCYLKVANADRALMEQVLEYERRYLRGVHQTLIRARAPGLPEAEREVLLKSLQFSGLPSGFTGRDRLTVNGFGASQVDLLIRFSRYLNQGLTVNGRALPPLAPQINASLGERLDLDVDVVRSSYETFVPFVENEEDFVNSVFKVYFRPRRGYIFWKTSAPLSASSDLIKNIVSTYRLSFELTGGPGTTPPEEAFKRFDEAMQYTRFSAREREMMSELRMQRLFDKIMFHLRWLRTDETFVKIQDTWGLYDYPFILGATEQLGFLWDMAQYGEKVHGGPVRQTMFVAGKNYFESRADVVRGYPVIPYSETMDRELDRTVKNFVKGEFRAVRAFQEAGTRYVGAWSSRPVAERPYVDVDMSLQIREPLYTDGVITNYRALENSFHQQTGGFFK